MKPQSTVWARFYGGGAAAAPGGLHAHTSASTALEVSQRRALDLKVRLTVGELQRPLEVVEAGQVYITKSQQAVPERETRTGRLVKPSCSGQLGLDSLQSTASVITLGLEILTVEEERLLRLGEQEDKPLRTQVSHTCSTVICEISNAIRSCLETAGLRGSSGFTRTPFCSQHSLGKHNNLTEVFSQRSQEEVVVVERQLHRTRQQEAGEAFLSRWPAAE